MDNKLNLSSLGDLSNLNLDLGNVLKNVDLTTSYMPSVNIPEVDFSKITFPAQEHREEEKMYWEQSINLLKSIELNTANLAMIVDLINKNNEKQDEIIAILSEVLEIAKAKNKEEADNLYRKTMNKVITFTKDVEAIQKLSVFAGTMYTLVINNIDKIQQAGQVVKDVADKFIK